MTNTEFPAPICVVQHRTARAPDLPAQVLGRCTALTVKRSLAGERLQPGTVYLAPPDAHLIVNLDGTLDFMDGRRIRPGIAAHRTWTGKAMPMRGWSNMPGDGVRAVAAYVWSITHPPRPLPVKSRPS
jgi:CheB methylesterase